MAQTLALVPLCPCTAAIAASLGRQGVHPGQIDAGDEILVLCGAIVQIELLVSLCSLPGQVAQGGEIKGGGGKRVHREGGWGFAQKKQQEKEEQKEVRARMREEAKLAKEIEEERKKLEKEQQHYQNALQRINAQLEAASDADRAAIEEKKAELVAQLDKIDKEFADVDYREANQRAGYVYVISNIGAFGENVYKIGMTRRLDPQDRVDELGDASVPFNFDVHAMIFSNDAPKLEAALHNAFADRKLNFVNQRREFFNVSLDEIKQVIKDNYDKSVEFVELAPAEQYRESLKLKEQMKKKCIK